MILNVVGLELTDMLPPCCSTILLQIDKPRPVPTDFVVNNGSKIFGISESLIPGPSSSISIIAKPSF